MSELMDAIQQGDRSRVISLLDGDPALLRSQEGPLTPLLQAIYHGENDLARLFVERGAPVSFAEACALGDLALVQRRLESDPDALNRRTADGHAPLGLSIFFRHPEVARFSSSAAPT
jgi:ankyrin repeat protein